tara:strand:- start:1098 stop:1298 length:201 start_codon:yes stop_codon:yes gene_type:complete
MNKIISVYRSDDATLLYIFGYLAIGYIHQRDRNKVKGLIFGLWRFQLQISLGYSEECLEEGDVGHA